MKYKMICIDIDGTLLNKRMKLTKMNEEIIKKAHEQGVEIVIATGRLYNNAAYFSELLGVSSPVISANGALVYDRLNKNVIYKAFIPKDECLEIYNLFKKHKIHFHFTTSTSIVANTRLINLGTKIVMATKNCRENLKVKYCRISKEAKWLELFNKEDGKIVKAIAMSMSKNAIAKLKADLEKIPNIVLYPSGDNAIEINFKTVSKGNAVQALMDLYGYKKEEIICIGDNENDISMIELAGLGIAMGNAVDKVKKVAQYVTDTNGNSGVGKAIEKFVLNKN